MSRLFQDLSRISLLALAAALRQGRIAPPYLQASLQALLPAGQAEAVRLCLRDLEGEGMTQTPIARMLEALAEERRAAQTLSDRLQIVWSPPDLAPEDSRDTWAVVQELFLQARTSVDIVTYALDSGDKAKALFGGLAAKMDAANDLHVRLFLNLHQDYRNPAPPSAILQDFKSRFRSAIWPGHRLPELYYDPRSLDDDLQQRASLHAKLVLIDGGTSFLTSANFTQAAQERNIEAGFLIDDERLTTKISQHLGSLIERGNLLPLALDTERDPSFR